MYKLGTSPRSFVPGKICFKFSVQCTLQHVILGSIPALSILSGILRTLADEAELNKIEQSIGFLAAKSENFKKESDEKNLYGFYLFFRSLLI